MGRRASSPEPPRPEPSPLIRALCSPGFRQFFAAHTISQWGNTFNAVAIVILVYRITGSGLKVSGAVAFEIAPVLLLGFVAGAAVDRLSRRRVLVTADLVRAGIAALLAVFHSQLWTVYAAAFGLSAFSVFFHPAAASVLPALVGEVGVVGANSAVWSAAVISQMRWPPPPVPWWPRRRPARRSPSTQCPSSPPPRCSAGFACRPARPLPRPGSPR